MTDPERDGSWDIRPLAAANVEAVGEALGLARLHQGDGSYLVAWDGAVPVGHLHLAMTDPPEIQDVNVAPSHRRRGVATSLVAAAEREARTRGRHEVRLEVSIDDPAAQTFYARCGYADAGLPPRRVTGEIEIRTGPIQVDDTLVTWRKPLG